MFTFASRKIAVCPKCGSKAEIRTEPTAKGNQRQIYVKCTKCQARGATITMKTNLQTMDQRRKERRAAENAAIKAWEKMCFDHQLENLGLRSPAGVEQR